MNRTPIARHGRALALAAALAGLLVGPALAQTAPVDAPRLIRAGQGLAIHGAPGVPPCFTCHGAQGLGDGGHFPRIAGQPAQFIIDRVHTFQARARDRAPAPGTMTAVAAKLDEQQIREAAAFLSHLEIVAH